MMGAVVRPIRAKDKYRVVEDTKRPFRIWDSVEKREVPHRCYITERRAFDSALLIVRWEKVGRTLEVFNITNGKLLGVYARRVDSISFSKG
jgi:hypothetical protein